MEIRIAALHAIIDLLLLFGFQLLCEPAGGLRSQPPQDDDSHQPEEKGEAPEDMVQSMIMMLSGFLDSKVSASGVQDGTFTSP